MVSKETKEDYVFRVRMSFLTTFVLFAAGAFKFQRGGPEKYVLLFAGSALGGEALSWGLCALPPGSVTYTGARKASLPWALLWIEWLAKAFVTRTVEDSLFADCVAALRQHPTSADAYFELATLLHTGEGVKLPTTGTTMTKRDLLVECLRYDDKHANAYFNLAEAMLPTESSITLSDGRSLSRRELYAKSIECSPNNSRAFVQLAATLSDGETITLASDRQPLAKVQLLEHAATIMIQQDEINMLHSVGAGGYGEVWRATYRGTTVAVKKATVKTDAVRREIRVLLAILPHPNIVGFVGAVHHDSGNLWIVMEFVDGPTLHSHIAKGVVDASCVVRVALQLCDALLHLHAQRVYHLDLTPRNVLLDSDRVKLCDFGLSRKYALDAASVPLTHGQGTPNYAAPEQFDIKAGTASSHTDVYGLGATLYHAVTGHAPWHGAQPHQIIAQFVLGNACDAPLVAYPNCGCDAALSALIAECMALDPKDRPTLAAVRERLTTLRFPHAPSQGD